MYTPQLLDHFQNPRNAGLLPPPAVCVRVENPVCGDILELSAVAPNGRITEIRFRVRGCTASIACASATTTLLEGIAVAEMAEIHVSHIEAEVGHLETASKHAARLCADGVAALAAALENVSGALESGL